MIIGFTGSSVGMSYLQRTEVFKYLNSTLVTEFHHGMCIGSDAEAHEIAFNCNLHIVGHPPINPSRMMIGCICNSLWEPKPYLDRNRDIVHSCDLLLVAPHEPEYLRSGTWSTKRYAGKINKPFHILTR